MSRRFNFLATGIGSLPFRDPKEACELIFRHMPEAPHWPQLPQADPQEGMIEQFLDGMPGVVEEGDGVYLRPLEPYQEWERFYQDYETVELNSFAIDPDRARGFYTFLEEVAQRPSPQFLKGQVTGPITLGLSLKDKEGAAAFFDQDLRDMILKLVAMKARWQQVAFKRRLPQAETIIFIDEPTLSSYGSAFMNVSRDQVINVLREVIDELPGLKGAHICGNTDWPMIMEIGLDIIDFDAYNYVDSFVLYARELQGFLEGGGVVGWGIVPTDEGALKGADSRALADRLRRGINLLAEGGFPKELLCEQSIITPSCGAGSLSEEAARRVYQLTQEVGDILRENVAL